MSGMPEMIEVFYGDDRVAAKKAIGQVLGAQYEVLEGAEIRNGDMPSIFFGGSLLAKERAILIRDLGENKEIFEKIGDFLETPHKVVIFEGKIDKRAGFYKALKEKVRFREFRLVEDGDKGAVFDVFKVAKRDGRRAVEILEKIEAKQEPYQFVGLMVSQALKDLAMRQGSREKKIVLALAKLDMEMKSTVVEPWTLVKSFLIRLASL